MASLINKARKPKFELHLKIYDLNNVPLVSGKSLIKWHFPHSIHSEHRGRTHKCAIANHRVEYSYAKMVPVRIAMDKNNALAECPLEFEVLQEFTADGGRDEKIVLGRIALNLSEYVEESQAFVVDVQTGGRRRNSSFDRPRPPTAATTGTGTGHGRKKSTGGSSTTRSLNSSMSSPASGRGDDAGFDEVVHDGVIRRYLMQDSKINSTLKIGILMLQTEGERNFVAPTLKTAPVFGGIAGFMAGEQVEQDDVGQLPSISKSRDASEVQDMYRRALAASWAAQPGELAAHECIEDIFAGGDGWKDSYETMNATNPGSTSPTPPDMGTGGGPGGSSRDRLDRPPPPPPPPSSRRTPRYARPLTPDDNSDSDYDDGFGSGTLRPGDLRRLRGSLGGGSGGGGHRVSHSAASSMTVLAPQSPRMSMQGYGSRRRRASRGRNDSIGAAGGGGFMSPPGGTRSRSESLASLATTLGSERDVGGAARGSIGYRRARELDEDDAREDLVAWAMPGAVV